MCLYFMLSCGISRIIILIIIIHYNFNNKQCSTLDWETDLMKLVYPYPNNKIDSRVGSETRFHPPQSSMYFKIPEGN